MVAIGNDKMTGGTEADVFVFNADFGNDTITDFWTGAGRTDRIWIQGAGAASQTSTRLGVLLISSRVQLSTSRTMVQSH